MILNIRGCSGSGKTWLMRRIMEGLGPPEPILDADGRPEGYLLRGNIRVIGTYENQCGGCDAVKFNKDFTRRLRLSAKGQDETLASDLLALGLRQEDVTHILDKAARGKGWAGVYLIDAVIRSWAQMGHVIFEGLIVSGIHDRWLRISKEVSPIIWAFLDTPIDVCVQRILERNGGKPFNVEYLEDIRNSRTPKQLAIVTEEGERAVWIDHARAFKQVMEIIHQEVPELRLQPPGETSGKTFILPLNASRLCPL